VKIMNNILIVLAACVVVVLIIEAFSIGYGYETQQAKIINTQDDSKWGYVGEDKRTLVEWPDKTRGYLPGALGEPGETITARRQKGTASLLGWCGDVSYSQQKLKEVKP
jgi:hypothetical protein